VHLVQPGGSTESVFLQVGTAVDDVVLHVRGHVRSHWHVLWVSRVIQRMLCPMTAWSDWWGCYVVGSRLEVRQVRKAAAIHFDVRLIDKPIAKLVAHAVRVSEEVGHVGRVVCIENGRRVHIRFSESGERGGTSGPVRNVCLPISDQRFKASSYEQ
jgi:hypothetical protein